MLKIWSNFGPKIAGKLKVVSFYVTWFNLGPWTVDKLRGQYWMFAWHKNLKPTIYLKHNYFNYNLNRHEKKYQMRGRIHLLFFKPAGFASKRAFTKVPTFSLKLSSGKLSCRMIVITIIVRFPTHNWCIRKKKKMPYRRLYLPQSHMYNCSFIFLEINTFYLCLLDSFRNFIGQCTILHLRCKTLVSHIYHLKL